MKNAAGGFTLVELMIVISIIGILSSIILGSVNVARGRGLDARIQADLANVQLALLVYNDTTGVVPSNQMPGSGYCNDRPNFLFELVNGGYIGKSIQTPQNGVYYCYYDYGSNNSIGALIVSSLVAAAPTATGYPNTCRPWPPDVNWCSTSNNTSYCLCTPY